MKISGTKTKKNRLCLLCATYISIKAWKKHLLKCEPLFKKKNKLSQ